MLPSIALALVRFLLEFIFLNKMQNIKPNPIYTSISNGHHPYLEFKNVFYIQIIELLVFFF